MITNKQYKIDRASLSDQKLLCDFAMEMSSDVQAQGNKPTRGRTPLHLRESPSLMVSASGVLNTTFLLSDPNEVNDRLKLLQQKKTGRKQFRFD